jgi:hypothetical protein
MSATTTPTAEAILQLLNESKTRRLTAEEWTLCEAFANEDDPTKRESRLHQEMHNRGRSCGRRSGVV